jgi:hypothetical protein
LEFVCVFELLFCNLVAFAVIIFITNAILGLKGIHRMQGGKNTRVDPVDTTSQSTAIHR